MFSQQIYPWAPLNTARIIYDLFRMVESEHTPVWRKEMWRCTVPEWPLETTVTYHVKSITFHSSVFHCKGLVLNYVSPSWMIFDPSSPPYIVDAPTLMPWHYSKANRLSPQGVLHNLWTAPKKIVPPIIFLCTPHLTISATCREWLFLTILILSVIVNQILLLNVEILYHYFIACFRVFRCSILR